MSLHIIHCSKCGGIVTLTTSPVRYLCPRCRYRLEREQASCDEMQRLEDKVAAVEHYTDDLTRKPFGWRPTPMGDDSHDHRNPRKLRDYGKNSEPVRVQKGYDIS